ncbi:MAG: SpoIVB peptidase S55 domain-containing protein [Faecousia sp.]
MRRMAISAALAVFLMVLFPFSALAEPLLVPVGQTVGLQLRDNTVTIAAFDDALGTQARDAGLKIGDIIVKVNGKNVHNTDEIREVLDAAGDTASLLIRRGSKELEIPVKITPTDSGAKLGVYLKQGISGIGTVTWYDPSTGQFGALGHGVNGSSGVLLKMAQGTTYPAQVQSVTKGKSGRPGQLKGSCDNMDACGELLRNTPQGVFGKSRQGWLGEPIPIADASQVHPGQACIRSTVSGCATGDYSVEILKVYPATRADGRNLLLKITDPTLLEATGGIVQGMSGSPIIQDGKLVGAVTHVLVNDPTVGYGIYIQNMLDAAS